MNLNALLLFCGPCGNRLRFEGEERITTCKNPDCATRFMVCEDTLYRFNNEDLTAQPHWEEQCPLPRELSQEQQRVADYFKSYNPMWIKHGTKDPLSELIESHRRIRSHMEQCSLCVTWWCRMKRRIKDVVHRW